MNAVPVVSPANSRFAFHRRLASAGAWVGIDALASRGLLFLAMMLAARSLGPEAFGRLTAIQATLVVLVGFVADAMRITAARNIAALRHGRPDDAGRLVAMLASGTLATATLAAAGLWLFAPWLAGQLLRADELDAGLRIGALVLLFDALSGLATGILHGLRRFRSLAIAGAASGTVLLTLVAVTAGRGDVNVVLWAMAQASATGAALRIGLALRELTRAGIRPRFEPARADLAVLTRFSLPALLTSLCWAPANWLVAVLLVRSPGGFRELALLGVANQWFALLLFVPNLVGTVLLPVLCEAVGRGDRNAVRQAFRLGVRSNLAMALPAALAVCMASSLVMSWYGSSFRDGWPVLALVAMAAAAASLQQLFGNLFVSLDRMWVSAAIQLTWVVCFVGCAVLAIRMDLGAAGVAGAMLLAYLVQCLHASRRAAALLPEQPAA